MAGTPGFLEFFILEASDYIEQLDALLGRAPGAPDGEGIQRAARALRGTATMAKLPAFAELAASVERVGRAMRERSLAWDQALGGALIAAVDDLKTLLHAARTWSTSEDERARTRAAELARFAPSAGAPASGGTGLGAGALAASSGSHGTASADSSLSTYAATEAANIAAGLELLAARSGDRETAGNVLRRIRALRGVAGVKEIASLAEALETTEDATRTLEGSLGELTPDTRRLLETSAGFLRAISTAMRSGADVQAPGAARAAFEDARTALEAQASERERIVPIARLFYDDDASGVVEGSRNPPTTAKERFRLELVSLGEHLGQVAAAARSAETAPPPASARARRDIRRAVQALEAAAESFGERDIAAFVRSHDPRDGALDGRALSALENLASALTEPGMQSERLRSRLRDMAGEQQVAPSAPTPRVVVPALTPEPLPAPVPALPAAPASPTELLLDESIVALDGLNTVPLASPTLPHDDESDVVPIELLLYRGRGALDRAVELRDAMRRNRSTTDPDVIEELFDLLDLARAE